VCIYHISRFSIIFSFIFFDNVNNTDTKLSIITHFIIFKIFLISGLFLSGSLVLNTGNNFKFSYNSTSNLTRLTDDQISDLIEYSHSLKITNKLIVLSKAENMLQYNVNLNLFMDKLIIDLGRC